MQFKGQKTTAIETETTVNERSHCRNVKALIVQLEAWHSAALTVYLNAPSRFQNYSFGSILEIARQGTIIYLIGVNKHADLRVTRCA